MKTKLRTLKDLIDEFDCNVTALVPNKSVIKENIKEIINTINDIEGNLK